MITEQAYEPFFIQTKIKRGIFLLVLTLDMGCTILDYPGGLPIYREVSLKRKEVINMEEMHIMA